MEFFLKCLENPLSDVSYSCVLDEKSAFSVEETKRRFPQYSKYCNLMANEVYFVRKV